MEENLPESFTVYRFARHTHRRWKVHIVSYKVGDQYFCTVDNDEPGATLSRSQGPTREEAEKKAIQKKQEMLAKTRVLLPQ